MILEPIDGTGSIGIWPTGILGTVRITTYGDMDFSTFNAAELIAAIQEEAK